jgi:hypothetical protein
LASGKTEVASINQHIAERRDIVQPNLAIALNDQVRAGAAIRHRSFDANKIVEDDRPVGCPSAIARRDKVSSEFQ